MAEVWLARFNGVGGFQKQVVLKTILPHLSEDPEFVRMFINEALLAARLNHPNIVQIFDLGRLEGRYFIAMEHVPGRSFRQISRRRREQGELIPAWFILRVMAAVCDGLYYAHEYCDEQGNPLGLVHRDVSPENIMISFTGIAKILDFGVAKATTAATQTKAGTLKGKYSYISPEQVKGAPADRRSDVYALGVILYEFLTGIRPFRGNNDLALLREIAKGNPTLPQKIAPWIKDELQNIILTALAIDPNERYSDTGRLGIDILEFLRKSGDQISQRDMGLYVSSLFPDEPTIPSDVQKRLFSVQTIEREERGEAKADPPDNAPSTSAGDSGTIEITGLDSWEGDDIPPVDFKEVKRAPRDPDRNQKHQIAQAKHGVPATSLPPKKESLHQSSPPRTQARGHQRDQDANPLSPPLKANLNKSASLPTIQETPQPPPGKGVKRAHLQSKATNASHVADNVAPSSTAQGDQGKGSWLQRIIRKEPHKPTRPALPKDESSTRETSKHLASTDKEGLDFDTSISIAGNEPGAQPRAAKGQMGQAIVEQPAPAPEKQPNTSKSSVSTVAPPQVPSVENEPPPKIEKKFSPKGDQPNFISAGDTKVDPLSSSETKRPISGALPTPQSEGPKSGALPTPQSRGTKSGALPTPQSGGTKSGALPTPQSRGTKSGALPTPQSEGTKSGALPTPQSEGTKSGALPSPHTAGSIKNDVLSSSPTDDQKQEIAKIDEKQSKPSEAPTPNYASEQALASPSDKATTERPRKKTSDIFGVQRPSYSSRNDDSDIFTAHSGVAKPSNAFDRRIENTPNDPRSIFDIENDQSRVTPTSVFDRESKSIFDLPNEPVLPESGFSFKKTQEEKSSGFSKKTEDDFINRFREMGRHARSRATQSIAVPPESDWSLRRESPLPSNPAADHFENGLSSLRQGNYDNALKEWEAAISHDPDNRLYQTNIQRLRDLIASKK